MRSKAKSLSLILAILFLASCVTITKPVSANALQPNSWAELAPMHQARADLGVAVVNGEIYAIGGSTTAFNSVSVPNGNPADIGETPVGTNEQYDPSTNIWTFKASMPDPRVSFATAVYQNKIYCIGGSGSTLATEVYDPADNTWTLKAPIPQNHFPIQANVIGNEIYVIEGGAFSDLFDFDIYTPANDTWSSPASIGGSLNVGYVSTVLDDKIYVLGGIDYLSDGSTGYVYDPQTGSWGQGPCAEMAVAGGGAVSTTGIFAPKRLYLVGVQPGGATSAASLFPTQAYDPSTNSWTTGAPMPTGRNDFGVANINDSLYFIGGYTFNSSPSWGLTYPSPPMTPSAANEKYLPIGYGTPDPSYVLEHYPPAISVQSPLNETYANSTIPLVYASNKQVSWQAYSLDGKQNVTISGNSTLTDLTGGLHTLTVYANDTYGNLGASQTVSFNVKTPQTYAYSTLAAILAASAAAIVVGLTIYLKKNRKKITQQS